MFIASLVILLAVLPNVSQIARRIDNSMLEDRRPNRRDAWWL